MQEAKYKNIFTHFCGQAIGPIGMAAKPNAPSAFMKNSLNSRLLFMK